MSAELHSNISKTYPELPLRIYELTLQVMQLLDDSLASPIFNTSPKVHHILTLKRSDLIQ